jgi:hypothetical protein
MLMGRKLAYMASFRPINIVVDEGEDVGALTGVVDGDDAVGEHQRRVREVGAVHVGGAAVGLQLVAEVADVAAHQPAVDADRRLRRDLLHLLLEQLEDRAVADFLARGRADRRRGGVDVVGEVALGRAGARPHI